MPTEDQIIVQCTRCGRKAELEHAIETGWIPSYWDCGVEVSDEPLCGKCVRERISWTNGEPELIPITGD